jgi:hypothetical protein
LPRRQGWRSTGVLPLGPGPAHRRGQLDARLVDETQPGSARLGVCLIRGHSWATHRAISASLRSTALRAGRCRRHRIALRRRHTCPGWCATPVICSITWAMRASVHRSLSNRQLPRRGPAPGGSWPARRVPAVPACRGGRCASRPHRRRASGHTSGWRSALTRPARRRPRLWSCPGRTGRRPARGGVPTIPGLPGAAAPGHWVR